jgi:hypothetical protein
VATLVVLAILTIGGCAQSPASTVEGRAAVILHGDHGPVRVDVEQADSPAERQRGLMGRTSLAADEGMLFLFEEGPTTSEFWMKDTLIPLSIAFWNVDGLIVGIRDMDPCTEDPCPTYGSPEPYVGALEVNVGFFAEQGVTTGDRIELVG